MDQRAGRVTPGQRGDEGSATPFAVLSAVGLLLAVGLVVDGGAKVRALQRADAAAAEAARAAGQALQPAPSVRGQAPRLDAAAAARAGRAYLTGAGVSGTVTVRGDAVEVTTTVTEPTVVLAAIGIPSVTARGDATARLVRGLDQEVP